MPPLRMAIVTMGYVKSEYCVRAVGSRSQIDLKISVAKLSNSAAKLENMVFKGVCTTASQSKLNIYGNRGSFTTRLRFSVSAGDKLRRGAERSSC